VSANNIEFKEFKDSDLDSLLQMGLKLWNDFTRGELLDLLEKNRDGSKQKILIASDEGKNIGFAIFSIRVDYVEGARQSPTGYLEGIFVEQTHRKLGIAKKFLEIGEDWCRNMGCSQIGSDTWLTDRSSREFHKKVGFWEEEEVVHFLKNL
jgi:aminoglycoside 6'-N-acetyltransferase I